MTTTDALPTASAAAGVTAPQRSFTTLAALSGPTTRRMVERNAWLLLEPFLPGATLFLLLVTLMFGYLREGFGAVRQHALAPDAGKATVNAATRRRWWQCPCGSRLACRCVQAFAGQMHEHVQAWARGVCAACR